MGRIFLFGFAGNELKWLWRYDIIHKNISLEENETKGEIR